MSLVVRVTGAAGSGKDTVGHVLESALGFKVLRLADALKDEVAQVFSIDRALLDDRAVKTQRSPLFAPSRCANPEFVEIMRAKLGNNDMASGREALQWYGTEYRRQRNGDDYWVDQIVRVIESNPTHNFVVTDVRFANENDALASFDGELWLVTRRRGAEQYTQHASELWWPTAPADRIFANNGTLADVREWTLTNGLDLLSRYVRL